MKSIFTGMKVEVCNFSVAVPISYADAPNGKRCTTGVITNVLKRGFAIKFDGYPHIWDYSNRESRCFRQAI